MHDAIFELLEQRGPALYALLVRLTLCEHTAEDLLQDLFVKLSQHDAMAEVKNPYAYARRTAINLGLDWRRGRSQHNASLTAAGEPAGDGDPPITKLIEAEQVERILDAASNLTEPMREVFILRHVQQEEYTKIAEHLDKTPHQVRALCSKATRMIRDKVNRPTLSETETDDAPQ